MKEEEELGGGARRRRTDDRPDIPMILKTPLNAWLGLWAGTPSGFPRAPARSFPSL